MTSVDDLIEALKYLEDKPKFERQLEFASLLTDYFKSKGIKPIVVGGLSVEIYTRNDYHTHDIDFVSDGWDLFDDLLTNQLGFTRTQREWYHLETEIAVEVRIEDIIIHRIEGIAFSLKFPKDDEDYEWAYRMFLIHKEDIDLEYLVKRAKQLQIYNLMENWF